MYYHYYYYGRLGIIAVKNLCHSSGYSACIVYGFFFNKLGIKQRLSRRGAALQLQHHGITAQY
jgi:hypothetical protein